MQWPRGGVVVVGQDRDFEVLVAQDGLVVQGRRVEASCGAARVLAGVVVARDWFVVVFLAADSVGRRGVRGLQGADGDGEGEGWGCEVGREVFAADLGVGLGEGVEVEVVEGDGWVGRGVEVGVVWEVVGVGGFVVDFVVDVAGVGLAGAGGEFLVIFDAAFGAHVRDCGGEGRV